MECPICMEKLNNPSITLECRHRFHEQCLIQWIETGNNSCPYCRETINLKILIHKTKDLKNHYRFKSIKRKSIKLDGKCVSFVEKNLINANQNPYAWIIENKCYYPIYKLIDKNDSKLITQYLRCCILYSDKPISTIRKTCINDDIYDTSMEFLNHSVISFKIIYDWIYELIRELKYRYNFFFPTFINTMVIDIYFKTIKELKVNKNKYFQTIVIASVKTCLKKSVGIDIPTNLLVWYTDGGANKSLFTKSLNYHKELFNQIEMK